MAKERPLYYGDYLALDKITTAQHPESARFIPGGVHDETLFIVTHQAFELWFVQIRHELKSVLEFMDQENIDDNSEEMARIVQRLERIVKIIRLINTQFEVLETMQPLDFLEFRSFINPASGFQSKQFRLIEAQLGLRIDSRHMPGHYKSQGAHHGGFTADDYKEVSEAENGPTLLNCVKHWLGRMPFFEEALWKDYQLRFPNGTKGSDAFLSDYFNSYEQQQRAVRDRTLVYPDVSEEQKAKAEVDYQNAIHDFKRLFIEEGSGVFSPRELSSALFIMLYRHYPMLRLPFQVLNALLDIDELISTWRYKHYLMVRKMIGTKPGTGGSPGAAYLMGALQKNNVFTDLNLLATYFIDRQHQPQLPPAVVDSLNFRR